METFHERSSIILIRSRARPTGQHKGQAQRSEATTASWPCLVHPCQIAAGRRIRDLALFNLAIHSKLRGSDLVALLVDDVAPNGYAIDRANVRQRKTEVHLFAPSTSVRTRH